MLSVPGAMTQTDPAPRERIDSPAAAVCRRLPDLDFSRAAEILCTLNGLGLTKVPPVAGTVSPAATTDLTKWIREEWWRALGVDLRCPTN